MSKPGSAPEIPPRGQRVVLELQYAGRLLASAGRALVLRLRRSGGVLGLLAWPLLQPLRWLAALRGAVAERRALQRNVARTVGPIAWRERLAGPFRRGAEYLLGGAWLRALWDRRWLAARGLPALAVAAAAMTLSERPRAAGAAGGRPARVWLALRQQVRRAGLTPALRRQLAGVASQSGNPRLGVSLLAATATLADVGDAEAQQAIAVQLVRRGLNRARLDEAVHRLRLALTVRPDDVKLRRQLARLLQRQGHTLAAVEVLRPAATRQPALRAELATLLLAHAGRLLARDRAAAERAVAAARAEARRALPHVRRAVAARPDSAARRLTLARLHVQLSNHREAVGLLRPALPAAASAVERRVRGQLLAQALTGLARGLEGAARAPLLAEALRVAPGFLAALDLLGAAASRPEGEWARQQLAALERRAGADLSSLHGMWGMRAWDAGRPAEAILHLERALRGGGGSRRAALLNNLAHIVTRVDPPDLARGLELIDEAIALDPADDRFRETRGQILVALGRDRDALGELQRALRVSGDPAGLHRLLAGCYERLGLPGLSARHRAQAGPSR